ncbi:MAG: hypothetical protein VCF24_20115, partial [Candidatus Latescibacterota bacterium]
KVISVLARWAAESPTLSAEKIHRDWVVCPVAEDINTRGINETAASNPYIQEKMQKKMEAEMKQMQTAMDHMSETEFRDLTAAFQLPGVRQ